MSIEVKTSDAYLYITRAIHISKKNIYITYYNKNKRNSIRDLFSIIILHTHIYMPQLGRAQVCVAQSPLFNQPEPRVRTNTGCDASYIATT